MERRISPRRANSVMLLMPRPSFFSALAQPEDSAAAITKVARKGNMLRINCRYWYEV